MLQGIARACLPLVLVTIAACSPADDNAAPVATPSVTISRSDVAIGSPVDMTYRFAVAPGAPALDDDYLVFVHFLDADGELMWTDDHPPPTPVRQWKPGSTIEYTRTMFVPKFPYVGEARVQIGIYPPGGGDRLPLAAETEGQRAYRVASFSLRLQSDNLFVVFREGWHETEASDDGSGFEWQWSNKEGTLSFRNPRSDVTFYLQADQPVGALVEPQTVEVRLGPVVVDSFALPSGPRELRRIPIAAAQMGDAESVDVTVSVDRTFVPAAIPELRSADPRVLGIRVFRAFVQPR